MVLKGELILYSLVNTAIEECPMDEFFFGWLILSSSQRLVRNEFNSMLGYRLADLEGGWDGNEFTLIMAKALLPKNNANGDGWSQMR